MYLYIIVQFTVHCQAQKKSIMKSTTYTSRLSLTFVHAVDVCDKLLPRSVRLVASVAVEAHAYATKRTTEERVSHSIKEAHPRTPTQRSTYRFDIWNVPRIKTVRNVTQGLRNSRKK